MQTRYRAAATALLLTATGGLAATQGAADASGTHHTATRATTRVTSRATVRLDVTIRSTTSGPKLSSTTFRPGQTVFKVVRGNAGGSIQVLRLKPGYSLKQAGADFATLFGGSGDPKAAIRRVDNKVVFYGGMDVPAKGAKPNYWGTDIDRPGTYYVLNTGATGSVPPTSFHAKGTHQQRSLPSTGGYVNMADNSTGANVWRTPRTDPNWGWMRTTNHALEPHFVVLNRVKEATTHKDVSNYFASNDPNPPSFALAGSVDANVISPGHSFVWKYGVPKGKYLVMCFWPSKTDGVTPHAVMGMFRLFHLS